ncbi:glutathione S-transferase family protein [Pseudomonas sp. NFX224]|uniref:glutathione S-transferase family protein n=1 Tax=Pseudomonas sp. NFX224 TaxID=3402862 RepID=UPI003AFA2650
MERLKIYYSLTSPYAAKARMTAAFGGCFFEEIMVDPSGQPAELLEMNPLGKVPVLLSAEGPIFDSRLITGYLDTLSKKALHGEGLTERFASQKLEALSDGICDCMLAHVMERRAREAENVSEALLDRYWGKVTRSLDMLCSIVPRMSTKVTIGQVALRCTLGYLELRFSGKWEEGRAPLIQWKDQFDEEYSHLRCYLPRQP